MANLLSWLGGVANDIGGQFNRTANQVQRNVVNPAVNFGVRNVAQAQRNVGQVGANVQRGAFDLQQQANNARRQAEEEARRIAEQRTREIMSIGNQAQQGFKQTTNMVTAPVRVLNKSSQGVKVDQSQVVQDLIPIARFAKSADLARQGKYMQAAQNTLRVPFASEAADVSRQMAANSADQYHAGPKIQGVNLPTRAEIEDNKMFNRSVENAGNKTIGAIQNAPGVRKVIDGQLPGGFTLRQAGAFANDNIAKPTLMQANDMGEAIVGNNDQKRLDKLGYTNDLKGGSKLLYDTVSLASLGYSGTKAMQLVKAPTLGGALKLAPNVATRQFGSGIAQNTALQLSQGTPVQQLDPMQMALAGGTYALLGTGLPLTGKVAGKGMGKVSQAIDIQRAKPMMSAIETQKFANTMNKVTPQTAPDIPTKGRMLSEGYQDVSVGPIARNTSEVAQPVLFRSGDTDSKRGAFLSNDRDFAATYSSNPVSGPTGRSTSSYTIKPNTKIREVSGTTQTGFAKELGIDVDNIKLNIQRQARGNNTLPDGRTIQQATLMQTEDAIKSKLAKQGFDGVKYRYDYYGKPMEEYHIFNNKKLVKGEPPKPIADTAPKSKLKEDLQLYTEYFHDVMGRNITKEDYSRIQQNLMGKKRPYDGIKKNPLMNDPDANILKQINPTGADGYNPSYRANKKLADNMKSLAQTTSRNPDEMITVYRGARNNQKDIIPGDFITTDKENAYSYIHLDTKNKHIVSKKVRLGDILDDNDMPGRGEYLYRPGAYEEVAKKTAPKAKAELPKNGRFIKAKNGKSSWEVWHVDNDTIALANNKTNKGMRITHEQYFKNWEPVDKTQSKGNIRSPLHQEATKYKSAEDFQNALKVNYEDMGLAFGPKNKDADRLMKTFQGRVFHGTTGVESIKSRGFRSTNDGEFYNDGIYFSQSPRRSIEYMKQDRSWISNKTPGVITARLDNMKIKTLTYDQFREINKGAGGEELVSRLKRQGYDGIKFDAPEGEILVFHGSIPKIKNIQTLADIYHEATAKPIPKNRTIYEMAPKPKELPDAIRAGKKDVYYHGTTKSDAESMLKTGFNPKLSAKGKHTESPYALFVSKDKGRLAGDHSAGNYGDGAIVKVTPNTDVKLLDGQSRTWVDSMGQSRGAKDSAEWVKKLQKRGYDGIQEANGEITIFNPSKFTISEVSPKVKLPTVPNKSKAVPEPPTKLEAPAGKQVLPKGINKEDVVEVQQFGSTTKGMVGNDTDIAIFLDPKHPSFAKIGSEYNRKVGKTEYHVFPDNDEGRAVFNAMLDYKDPKYGTGKGIAIKLNKDTIFPVDNVKQDRFGVPFKEESVPVAKLIRNQEYQPRIGQSGEATTANVFKKGYQEGLSDQPMLVRKEGNKYTVLGGHSRTMGIEQRAEAGLNNPANIKARVYEDITDAQARQISRGANQGAQYENTLDMAKSISASISENKAPSVQRQNMVKGFGHDDYKYLWDVVKDNNILKEKVNAGGISAEETLAIARQGRVKGLEPEKVAGVIQGLDKAGKLTKQNAKNVINLLSGKIKAGQMRTNQVGMFGDVEKAVKAVDLLDEYQKVSAELVKKRNALAIATDTLDKKSPAYKELRLKVKEYGQKLKTVETEVVNQYNAKISKNVPEIPSKTPPPPKPPTKKVKMNEYGELQVKERGFVTTVKNSPQTTPEVAKGVKGKYEPITNVDTLNTARKEVGLGQTGRVNNKKAYEEAIDTAKRSEDYSTETQAQSLILIEHLQGKGRTQDAIDIVEKMSERATKNGQASQILAAYNRLKPEGVLMMAQREIDKAKAANPSKYVDLKIEKVQAQKLRKMATELQGLTGDERIVAQKEMLDEIGRLVPTPGMTKAVTLWKAGLLTGIKGGVSGNAVGNASNILVKKIADAPASAIDAVITKFTGNRSKVFTLKGWLSGFGEGLKAGKKQIKLGTGADDLASKLDYKKVYFSKNNPAGRFAQKYTDFVFGFYSASDKPWKMAALKNSLTDLATVEAKNKGLRGAAKSKFIKETVEAPPDNILVQATNDSLDATFQDATALGGMLSSAKRSLAKHGPVAGAVGEVVAPFTGIPSSVATKMYRYSLVSSAVDVVRAVKLSNKGQFDQAAQRKVSESIGKGITGTGLLGAGYGLWNAGLMTTGMPQDPQERDLWELEGKQPWSVKVGNQWLSLNYTGPVLAILGAGATAAQSVKEGNTLPQTAFIAGMGTAKAVLESSPLRGVQGTLDVISDPARNGPRYLESLAGSTMPTLSADIASSIDPLQREAMSPLDAITNRVPIWRYGLNPKVDPFGEPKANQAYGPQAIVDPFRMSEDRTTSLSTELRNLYNTNKDLGTMPSDFKKDFYGGDTKLNEKQIYDLTVKIKPEIKQAWEQIIADPRYQNLSPEQRKKVLDKAAKDIRAARKFETGVQGGFLNEGEARKKLEAGSKRILRGGQTDYINKETGGQDTPKQKYETALNDYEDKKKNGEISSIDEIKAQKALKKLQAQSEFDQDTVDLYGLSLKEIDGYLKSQPNGGGILEKLLALDDAMEASGSTRKFKNRKLYVATKSKSGGKKGRKGRKASTRKGTAIKIPSIKGSTYKAPKFVTRKIASRKLSVKSLPKIKSGKVYV